MDIPKLEWYEAKKDNLPDYHCRVLVATRAKLLLCPFYYFAILTQAVENDKGFFTTWKTDDLTILDYEIVYWAYVPDFKFKDE